MKSWLKSVVVLARRVVPSWDWNTEKLGHFVIVEESQNGVQWNYMDTPIIEAVFKDKYSGPYTPKDIEDMMKFLKNILNHPSTGVSHPNGYMAMQLQTNHEDYADYDEVDAYLYDAAVDNLMEARDDMGLAKQRLRRDRLRKMYKRS